MENLLKLVEVFANLNSAVSDGISLAHEKLCFELVPPVIFAQSQQTWLESLERSVKVIEIAMAHPKFGHDLSNGGFATESQVDNIDILQQGAKPNGTEL